MNFPVQYDDWKVLLTDDEQSFVQAMLVMKSPSAAADMCGIPLQTAKKYLKKPRITAGLDLARRQLRNETNFTPADVAEDLMLIRDMALGRVPVARTCVDKESGRTWTTYIRETNLPAAQKAVENLGRMLGVFTDKKEISMPASDNQILKKIESILGVTVDGEAEDVTDVIDQKFTEQEDNHLAALSVDAMVDELLEDPVLKDALSARVQGS